MIIKMICHRNQNIKFNIELCLDTGVSGKQIFVNDIPTHYLITCDGNVFNTDNGYEKQFRVRGQCKYKTVNIHYMKDGKCSYKTMLVHRLLAMAYIENPNNLPCVNHINGDKMDNRLINLEWVSYSENLIHAFRTGLHLPSHVDSERCNLTTHTKEDAIMVCEYLQMGYTPLAIHTLFKLDYDFAQHIYHRQTWKDVSKKYNFTRVILYNKFFTMSEVDKVRELLGQKCSYREISHALNLEYTEIVRGRLKQLKRQISKYNEFIDNGRVL